MLGFIVTMISKRIITIYASIFIKKEIRSSEP